MNDNPFNMLKEDHRKVSRLLQEIQAAGNGAAKNKAQLFERLRDELNLHAEIEEEYMYPLLEESEETKDLVHESYEEHTLVRTMLSEMEKEEIGSPPWTDRLQEMKEHIEYHVSEEEDGLFPEAEDLLSEEELQEMARNIHQARAQAAPAHRAGSK